MQRQLHCIKPREAGAELSQAQDVQLLTEQLLITSLDLPKTNKKMTNGFTRPPLKDLQISQHQEQCSGPMEVLLPPRAETPMPSSTSQPSTPMWPAGYMWNAPSFGGIFSQVRTKRECLFPSHAANLDDVGTCPWAVCLTTSMYSQNGNKEKRRLQCGLQVEAECSLKQDSFADTSGTSYREWWL